MKNYKRIKYLKETYHETLVELEQADSRVQQAVHFINAHLFEPRLTVSRMREQCHINGKDFSSKFAILIGYGPKNYILHHRIEAAKLLLQKTNVPVTVVAFSVGFNSLSAFDNAFKPIEGCKPSVWREFAQRLGEK